MSNPVTHCRIARVKLKASPNLVIYTKPPRKDGLVIPHFRRHSRMITNWWPDMVGYVIVVWDDYGRWTSAIRVHEDSVIPRALQPEFVADVIRRTHMAEIADDVLHGVDPGERN